MRAPYPEDIVNKLLTGKVITSYEYLCLTSEHLMEIKRLLDDYIEKYCAPNQEAYEEAKNRLMEIGSPALGKRGNLNPLLVESAKAEFQKLDTKFYYAAKSLDDNNYLPHQVESIYDGFCRRYSYELYSAQAHS